MKWTVLALCALFGFVAKVAAQSSVTNSGHGHSYTMTVSFNATTGVATWTRTFVRNSAVSGGPAGWVYTTTGPGGGYGTVIHDSGVGMAISGTDSGTWTPTPGTWYRIGARIIDATGVPNPPDVNGYWQAVEAAPTYGVTLKVPANGTPKNITYMALKAGNSIGSYMQPSGASSADWYIGNLPDASGIILVEVTGGFTFGSSSGTAGPGNEELVTEADGLPPTTYKPVSATVTPTAETSPGAGASATSGTPTAPKATNPSNATPSTAAPTATTTTTAPAPPTATGTVSAVSGPSNPTATGTAAATKEDIMNAANQISDRVRENSGKVVEVGNKIIEATDKVAAAVSANATKEIEATDKVAAAVTGTGTKLVEAANKSQSSFDRMNTLLETIAGKTTDMTATNAKIDTTNSKLEDVKANTAATTSAINALKASIEARQQSTADAQAAANASYSSAQTAGSSAGNAAGSSISAGVPAIAPMQPSADGSAFEIAVPGVATFSLDPASNSSVSSVIQWVRAFMAWLIGVVFWWWLWGEFKGLMSVAVGLPQAKGNTVAAGTGGQATSLVAAAAISVVLVGLPTAFFALTSFGAGLESNPFSGAPGPVAMALYLVYLFFPVEVIVSAIVAAFAVRKGGLVILASTAAVVRHIVP